jgi:hypothetical protein
MLVANSGIVIDVDRASLEFGTTEEEDVGVFGWVEGLGWKVRVLLLELGELVWSNGIRDGFDYL